MKTPKHIQARIEEALKNAKEHEAFLDSLPKKPELGDVYLAPGTIKHDGEDLGFIRLCLVKRNRDDRELFYAVCLDDAPWCGSSDVAVGEDAKCQAYLGYEPIAETDPNFLRYLLAGELTFEWSSHQYLRCGLGTWILEEDILEDSWIRCDRLDPEDVQSASEKLCRIVSLNLESCLADYDPDYEKWSQSLMGAICQIEDKYHFGE